MTIAKDRVVSIHYTLTNVNGDQLDSSAGQDPLTYLQGHGNIIPGLENALEGKDKGEKLTVTIEAKEAYGERNDQLLQEVPKSQFEGNDGIQVGMQFQAQTEQGVMVFTVKELKDDTVILDGNHPLAGETLNFDVEVVEVRTASEEELAHGHAHGPGGHNH